MPEGACAPFLFTKQTGTPKGGGKRGFVRCWLGEDIEFTLNPLQVVLPQVLNLYEFHQSGTRFGTVFPITFQSAKDICLSSDAGLALSYLMLRFGKVGKQLCLVHAPFHVFFPVRPTANNIPKAPKLLSTQELASDFSGKPRSLAASDSRSAAASRSSADDSGLSW